MSNPASTIALRDARARGRLVARQRGGTFAALANRDFRFLLDGTMAANVASWVQTIAQGWLVLELTGSAVALGALAFVRGIAMLLTSPFGGPLSDRFDRRLMMRNLATAESAVSASLLAVPVATGQIERWQHFAFCFLAVAAAGAFWAASPAVRRM